MRIMINGKPLLCEFLGRLATLYSTLKKFDYNQNNHNQDY